MLNGALSRRFGANPDDRLSWEQAEAACVSHGGHLASVTTIAELMALTAFCFDGLTVNAQVDCALGLRRTERCTTDPCPNNWIWTDGTTWSDDFSTDLSSDHPYQLGHSQNGHNGMHIEGHYGTRGILEGDYTQGSGPFVYVCELPTSNPTPIPTSNPT